MCAVEPWSCGIAADDRKGPAMPMKTDIARVPAKRPSRAIAAVLLAISLSGGVLTACGEGETVTTTSAAAGGGSSTSATTGAAVTTTTPAAPPVTTVATTMVQATTTTLSIDPAAFSASVDNRLFPLLPGTASVFEVTGGDGAAMIAVNVLGETRVVMGVECVVVRSGVDRDGQLVEEVLDWYAQDGRGNVWRFGRAVTKYDGAEAVGTTGSWEAGVGGAVPGIVMPAAPQVGDTYRVAYVEGEVEYAVEVLAVDVAVEVPFGSLTGALKTREWSPLEPGVVYERYYVPGVGLVLTEQIEGGAVSEKLVSQYGP